MISRRAGQVQTIQIIQKLSHQCFDLQKKKFMKEVNYTFHYGRPTCICFQVKSKSHRSLDLESLKIQVTPTTSKVSLPTIVRLFPPTIKPLPKHINMPMRFGRDSVPNDDQNSTPNMPQRFGRSWKVIRLCAECPGIRVPMQPHRPLRNNQYWSLLRTLANIVIGHWLALVSNDTHFDKIFLVYDEIFISWLNLLACPQVLNNSQHVFSRQGWRFRLCNQVKCDGDAWKKNFLGCQHRGLLLQEIIVKHQTLHE